MTNKDFDKNIKSTVDKHSSPIDVDSFWASIEGEVKDINSKKKKKRALPFYFLSLATSATVGILSFIYLNTENNFSIDKIFQNTSSEKNEYKNLSAISTEEKVIEEELIINQKIDLSKQINSTSKSISQNFTKSNQLISFDENNNFTPLPNNPKKDFKTENLERNDGTIINEQVISPAIIELKKMTLPQVIITPPIFEKIHLYRKGYSPKKTWAFNLGIQGGANFASRKLESNDTDTEPYAILRTQTESSKIGFQFGLRTGVKHRSGFNFSTGISFTQISERFKFKGSTFKRVMVENGVTAYEITINMDTIPVLGDFEYNQEIVHNTNYQNQYRLFEIPLLVGYQKDFDKWSWGLQTGIVSNISLKTIGIIFSPNNEFAYLETEQSDYFHSNIGMSYYFGGEGKYLFSEKIALTFSPHYRLFTKSFTNNKNGVSQKYSLTGLNLGVDFRF